MATTLYEATAGRFEQTLTATAAFLEKGRVHFTENGMSLDDLVEARLYPDMLPFRFQVVSAAHHSAGALDAVAETGSIGAGCRSDTAAAGTFAAHAGTTAVAGKGAATTAGIPSSERGTTCKGGAVPRLRGRRDVPTNSLGDGSGAAGKWL